MAKAQRQSHWVSGTALGQEIGQDVRSHACNPRTESEARGWPQVQGQTELRSEKLVLELKELGKRARAQREMTKGQASSCCFERTQLRSPLSYVASTPPRFSSRELPSVPFRVPSHLTTHVLSLSINPFLSVSLHSLPLSRGIVGIHLCTIHPG